MAPYIMGDFSGATLLSPDREPRFPTQQKLRVQIFSEEVRPLAVIGMVDLVRQIYDSQELTPVVSVHTTIQGTQMSPLASLSLWCCT
jgi:hypothetical protein